MNLNVRFVWLRTFLSLACLATFFVCNQITTGGVQLNLDKFTFSINNILVGTSVGSIFKLQIYYANELKVR